MSFIDENCIVFDNEDENKLAYTDIYSAFKDMVDMLLEMHLQGMGVTIEQFASVVGQLAHTPSGQETLQQILAVDDYPAFKRMMGKRNRELELEALKALEALSRQSARRSAAAADAGVREAEQEEEEELEEDEKMLRKAIQMSMVEAGLAVEAAEVAAKEREKEEADLRTAIALSLQIEEQARAPPPPPVTAAAPSSAASPPVSEHLPETELRDRMAAAARSMEESHTRAAAILPLDKVECAVTPRKPAGAPTASAPPPDTARTSGLSSLAGLPSLGGKTAVPSLQQVKATEAMARGAEARVRAEEERERQRLAVAAAAATSGVGQIARDEMEARAAHLRKQRDFILAQRKREREKAMEAAPAIQPPRPADPGAGAPAVAPSGADSHRAELSRALAAGMKSQLAGGNRLGLDSRKADLEATKAALKAEYGGV